MRDESRIPRIAEAPKTIFWALSGTIAVGVALYLAFLSISVGAVIARKHAENEVERLSGEVAMLESRYVELTAGITLERAHELGFLDVAVPRYVMADGRDEGLTLLDLPRDE